MFTGLRYPEANAALVTLAVLGGVYPIMDGLSNIFGERKDEEPDTNLRRRF